MVATARNRRFRSHVSYLVALLALAATATWMTGAAAASDPKPSPASSRPFLKRWAATMSGPKDLSAEQALENARNFDLIVGQPRTIKPHLAAMKAENPSLKVLFYLNGSYAQNTHGTAFPEGWYARTATGQKVRSTEFGNYLMDPRNADWHSSRIARCQAELSLAGGGDGCYLDMLGPGTLTDGYLDGEPIDPLTGRVWTMPDWVAATTGIASSVQAALSSLMIVGNGLGTGRQYVDPRWGPTSKLLDGIPAANAQGFVRGTSAPIGDFRSEAAWKADVDMLVDAGKRGRGVMAMTKIWNTPATQSQKDAVHRLALATFLLGTNGASWFFWSDDDDQGAYAQDHRYDHVDPGTPTNAYEAAGGAYVRRFSGGFVAVNPTEHALTVHLPGPMTSLEGVRSTHVTLAPHAGDVWVSDGSDPTPVTAPSTTPTTVPSTTTTTVPSTTTTTVPSSAPTTVPSTTPTTVPSSTPTTAPSLTAPMVSTTPGYWMATAAGQVYAFGGASARGNGAAGTADIEPTRSGGGYWLVDVTGAVRAFGDAVHHGQVTNGTLVNGESVTSMSRTPSGGGYWLFSTRGRVVPFGDAKGYGDALAIRLNGPILDSIPTPSGRGYYMVASDGGVFTFGDASFSGSMGSHRLNAPVQSLVPDPDGAGYWLVASDGGVFAFGAGFRGSMGGTILNRPITGMVAFGTGYLMVGEDGGIFNFSGKAFYGSLGANPPVSPVVAVASMG